MEKQEQQKEQSFLPQVFNFNETKDIRCLLVDNEPWFVAKDVCGVLGIRNHNHAVSQLDEEEVRMCSMHTPTRKGVGNSDPLLNVQQVGVVNESGMYSLIFRSRKEEARSFKRWVTSTVLPSIRRTGGYRLHTAPPEEAAPRERLAPPAPRSMLITPHLHLGTLAMLSTEEAGAWITLAIHCWDQGPLPEANAERLVGRALLEKVRYLLVEADGRLTFPWVERERARLDRQSKRNSINGRKGGRGNVNTAKRTRISLPKANKAEQLALEILYERARKNKLVN